ncbi:hypothetical protein K491DRAFT_682071 [Lophiostoma macrostomum CBS 122681]|uniref:NmrA-like domain-containing protein n=1 Tax=Lophiostoma macrostomum CBS 122681 TaxID=1314788 RepID=A0A6A6SYF9_9PLEO|nr:hypothetical protein K491DRAFT_682071 [Lophiostoma macrostomum CBS 122681]
MTQNVLVHDATGETGGDIVDGLIEDGSFTVAALVGPQLLQKPSTMALRSQNVQIVAEDLISQSVEAIADLLVGFDIVISAVAATAQLDQLKLVDAAAKAGAKWFVPCGFTSVSLPGGEVTVIRAEKETVHHKI